MSEPVAAVPTPERPYTVGTLAYSAAGVAAVCGWMLWGGFCYSMLAYVLVPTLLPLTLDGFGASGAVIGLVVGSIPSAMNFVMNPILSTASDRTRTRWGRRLPYLAAATPFVTLFMVLLGWTREIAGYLHAAWLPGVSAESLGIGLACVFGIAYQVFNLVVGSIYYYIFADVIPHRFIGRFMALLNLVFTAAGFVFNYFLLGYAADYAAWIYTGVGALYAASFGLMCVFVKEGGYPPPPAYPTGRLPWWRRAVEWVRIYCRECYRHPFYLALFVGIALTHVSTVCRSVFNLLFATKELGLTPDQYGKIMGIGSLVSLGAILVTGWLMDRIHPLRVFILSGVVVIGVNVWGYFGVVDYASFYGVGVLIVLVYSVQNVSALPMYVALFPPEKYGQFSSANAMVNSLLIIAANWGGGLAIDRFGYRFIFVWDFAFTLVSTAVLIYVYVHWKRLGGDRNYRAPAVG